MNKPTANYRMSKKLKFILASIRDPHYRGQWKRSMIDAEIEATKKPKSSREDRE